MASDRLAAPARPSRVVVLALGLALWAPWAHSQTTGTVPACAANEADQASILRVRGLRVPLCSAARPIMRSTPLAPAAPAEAVTPIGGATPALAPAAIAVPIPATLPPPATLAPNGAVTPAAVVAPISTAVPPAAMLAPNGGATPTGAPAPVLAPTGVVAPVPATLLPGAALAPSAAVSGGASTASINPLTPKSAAAARTVVPAKRPTREPDQLLLYWADSTNLDSALARIQRDFGLVLVRRTPLGNLGGVMLLFKTAATPAAAAAAPTIDALRTRLREALPEVTVDFNALYFTESGPRQYFGAHLGMSSGEGPVVPIGVVDTEVGAIAALKDVHLVRRSFLSPGEAPAPDAHGTAVASLIAGRDAAREFSGVATAAPLYSAAIMRRVGEHDGTTTFVLAQALDWLLGQQVRVINLSLGGPGDALMARLIDKVTHQPGVVVVAAAGNAGPDGPPSYPAAYPGVLAVTATNAADQAYAQANRGAYISLAAPGEDLWVPDTADGHYVSGTSFAAALVSGLAGRVLARAPGLSSDALLKRLCGSARDLGTPGQDSEFGCGLVQAAAIDGPSQGDLSQKK